LAWPAWIWNTGTAGVYDLTTPRYQREAEPIQEPSCFSLHAAESRKVAQDSRRPIRTLAAKLGKGGNGDEQALKVSVLPFERQSSQPLHGCWFDLRQARPLEMNEVLALQLNSVCLGSSVPCAS
jgi:hypothetical protein